MGYSVHGNEKHMSIFLFFFFLGRGPASHLTVFHMLKYKGMDHVDSTTVLQSYFKGKDRERPRYGEKKFHVVEQQEDERRLHDNGI